MMLRSTRDMAAYGTPTTCMTARNDQCSGLLEKIREVIMAS